MGNKYARVGGRKHQGVALSVQVPTLFSSIWPLLLSLMSSCPASILPYCYIRQPDLKCPTPSPDGCDSLQHPVLGPGTFHLSTCPLHLGSAVQNSQQRLTAMILAGCCERPRLLEVTCVMEVTWEVANCRASGHLCHYSLLGYIQPATLGELQRGLVKVYTYILVHIA